MSGYQAFVSTRTHCTRARKFWEILADDADYRKLQRAIAVVYDAEGLEPDFALTNVYLGRRRGLDSKDSLFILGRAVGWIARCYPRTGHVHGSTACLIAGVEHFAMPRVEIGARAEGRISVSE
jgi:hypothetical protein